MHGKGCKNGFHASGYPVSNEGDKVTLVEGASRGLLGVIIRLKAAERGVRK